MKNLYVMRSPAMAAGLRDMIRATGLWGTRFAAVELGSFAGEGAAIFVEAGADPLSCVDLWEPLTYRKVPDNARPDWAEAVFDRRRRRWLAAGRDVRKIKVHTQLAALSVADRSIDLVYVDAEHSFPAVCGDIRVWLPKLKKGGWMAGHDWSWPEVRRGVDKVLGHLGPPQTFSDSSWLYRIAG